MFLIKHLFNHSNQTKWFLFYHFIRLFCQCFFTLKLVIEYFLSGDGVGSFINERMINDAAMEIAAWNVVKLKADELLGAWLDVAEVLKIKSYSFAAFLNAIANGLFLVDVSRRPFKELKQILIGEFQAGVALMVLENA